MVFGDRTLGRGEGSETRHLERVPRKLLLLTNFFGSLDMEDDSSGFYISRDISYNLVYLILAPIQFFRENI